MAACAKNEFATWLNAYHSLLWYRSGFNTAIKCDHINNNLAESFNNKVKDLKDLPVHDMVDQIRIMIMRLWDLRGRLGDMLEGDKLPVVVQQVVNKSRNLSHLSVEKSSLFDAEVKDVYEFDGDTILHDLKIGGGGGTNFQIIFDYINKNMKDELPNTLIILTDGYADFPSKKDQPSYPVLWVINNKEVTPPWGQFTRILK
jgi:hypothetical protein